MDDRLYQLTYGELGETRAEVILRTMGLNAYAARMLLNDNRYGFTVPEPIDGIGYERYNPENADEWAMESLLAMSVEERRKQYGYPVGEKILVRFEETLDWSALVDSGESSMDMDPNEVDSQQTHTDPNIGRSPDEGETRQLDMALEVVSSG